MYAKMWTAVALAVVLAACGREEGQAAGGGVGNDTGGGQIGDAVEDDTGAGAADVGGSGTDAGKADVGPVLKTSWYATCGDPVCKAWKAKTGVPSCTTEKAGTTCAKAGATCDPKNQCNALLICADKDPKTGPGGCPISRRAAKTAIRYLSAGDEARVAADLQTTRLATWRYKGESKGRHLGFIIDDQPASAAVDPRGDRVDLYSYTSMAVAALKAQRRELDALKAELGAMKARLARCPLPSRSTP